MWVAIVGFTYYCPKDQNTDRCQHIPDDEKVNDFRRTFKVTDRHEFARGFIVGLRDEEEEGSTPLTKILDKACIRAAEDDMGVEEDGRIVTNAMLHPDQEVSE
jgi:hypothetical protein